ncbi:MAG TPA: hypothetical protein PLT47_09270, partial [Bacteroidales bacterium]|nr:hypothetical protein [Bacteroidales bacterium]
LNGLFPLYHSVEKFCADATKDGNATYRSNTFDLMTFRDRNITELEDDMGNKSHWIAANVIMFPAKLPGFLHPWATLKQKSSGQNSALSPGTTN